MTHAVAAGRLRPLVTLLHQYAGGYLALALANGLSCFFAMPWHWLGLAILCDVAILWTLGRLMTEPVIPAIGRKEWWLALSMFALFLLPLFLQSHGGRTPFDAPLGRRGDHDPGWVALAGSSR